MCFSNAGAIGYMQPEACHVRLAPTEVKSDASLYTVPVAAKYVRHRMGKTFEPREQVAVQRVGLFTLPRRMTSTTATSPGFQTL